MIPTMVFVVPTAVGVAPTVVGVAPTVVGVAPTVVGVAPTLVGVAPTVVGMAPIVVGMAPFGKKMSLSNIVSLYNSICIINKLYRKVQRVCLIRMIKKHITLYHLYLLNFLTTRSSLKSIVSR